MNTKKDIQNELEERSPFLAKLKAAGDKQSVPPNYFDQLEANILEQVGLEPKPVFTLQAPSLGQRLQGFLERFWQPRLVGSLASLALLLLASVFYFNTNTTSEIAANTELSEADALEYIAANIEDFETEQLLENFEISTVSASEMDLNEEELDEYLDDILQDIDLENLEELL